MVIEIDDRRYRVQDAVAGLVHHISLERDALCAALESAPRPVLCVEDGGSRSIGGPGVVEYYQWYNGERQAALDGGQMAGLEKSDD